MLQGLDLANSHPSLKTVKILQSGPFFIGAVVMLALEPQWMTVYIHIYLGFIYMSHIVITPLHFNQPSDISKLITY